MSAKGVADLQKNLNDFVEKGFPAGVEKGTFGGRWLYESKVKGTNTFVKPKVKVSDKVAASFDFIYEDDQSRKLQLGVADAKGSLKFSPELSWQRNVAKFTYAFETKWAEWAPAAHNLKVECTPLDKKAHFVTQFRDADDDEKKDFGVKTNVVVVGGSYADKLESVKYEAGVELKFQSKADSAIGVDVNPFSARVAWAANLFGVNWSTSYNISSKKGREGLQWSGKCPITGLPLEAAVRADFDVAKLKETSAAFVAKVSPSCGDWKVGLDTNWNTSLAYSKVWNNNLTTTAGVAFTKEFKHAFGFSFTQA